MTNLRDDLLQAIAALLFLLISNTSIHAQVDGLRSGERTWENAGPLTGDEDGVFAVRVVDRTSGLPIANARLEVYEERSEPAPSQWPALKSAHSDVDGWIRIPIDEQDSRHWFFLQAEGYAGHSFMGPDEDPKSLGPGTDFLVRLRTPFGEPVVGARIGLIQCCGHTPDAQVAFTDERGDAWLRRVEDLWYQRPIYSLWVEAEGYTTPNGHYVYLDGLENGEPIELEPAWSVRGRLRDARGEPLRHRLVGVHREKRGPWTRTDHAGAFVLHGLLPYSVLQIATDEAGSRFHTLASPPPGHDLDLVVPDALDGWDTVPVTIDLEDTSGEKPTLVQGVAVHVASGFARSFEGEAGMTQELALVPGEYLLVVDDERCEEVRATFEATAEATAPVRVPLSQRRPVRIQIEQRNQFGLDVLEHGTAVERFTAEGWWDVTATVLEGAPVFVPHTGRLAFRTRAGTERIVQTFDASALSSETPVVLRAPRANAFVFRPVDAAGEPVSVFESEVKPLASPNALPGQGYVVRWPGGSRELELSPESDDLARMVFTVPELPIGGHSIDLGDLVLPPSESMRIRVLDAHGEELEYPTIERVDGWWRERELDRPGDGVDILVHGQFPFTLRGEGPWTVRLPRTGISLHLVDEQGAPITRFEVYLGTECYGASDARDGTLSIESVKPGRHQLMIHAVDHVARGLEIDLREGEFREFTVRPRPR